MSRRGRRRGYPVAVLIGLEGLKAHFWNVFSQSVRKGQVITGENEYSFYESIVDHLRPGFKQGLKTILVATPNEKEYKRFMEHIRKHQGWMLKGYSLNIVTFEYLAEEATELLAVQELVRKGDFRSKLAEVSSGDISQVMNHLEKLLNDPKGIETLLFTLREVENAVYGDTPVEYILITEAMNRRFGRRTNRLLQIAQNKKIQTRIIARGNPAESRIVQLGGLVCILKS